MQSAQQPTGRPGLTLATLASGLAASWGSWAARLAPAHPQPVRGCEAHHDLQEIRAVAHDLRAPLLTVTSYLDLIVDGAFGDVSEEARAALRQCASVAGHAQHVVDTTLHETASPGMVRAVRVDLDAVVSAAVDALAASIAARGATVTVEGRLPRVLGDETALFRVFENLLQNAVKYGRPGVPPRIHVRAGRLPGGDVEVWVSDNGRGIRPDEHDAVLAPGVRGSAATASASAALARDTDGLGLGLATVSRLVARMHGTLTLESPPQGGTTVRITLPA